MKFYGYGTVPDGTARRAFLTDGDEVYIVAEGDTLLGRFRILKIGNATIEFEEISSGRQGKSNLEEPGPNT
jgi:GTPase